MRLLLAALLAWPVFATDPQAWVPARWPWTDARSLELLEGSRINCLLSEAPVQQFSQLASAARARRLDVLPVLQPGADPLPAARDYVKAGAAGIVLEGDYPEGTAARVADSLGKTPVIAITLRSRMPLSAKAAVVGTYQGVWPGVAVTEDGAAKAAPSGSAWIDTNSGFLRAATAWGGHAVWIANRPPEKAVILPERYGQAVADAEMVGARWVAALDAATVDGLAKRDPRAMKNWAALNAMLGWYEGHPEWRELLPAGKLAVIQSAESGALLSGGVLDMISVKHTPVRAVPPSRLTPEVLKGATMAVDVNLEELTPAERETLKAFSKAGGTVLTAPAGWRDAAPANKDRITLDEKETKRLDDIWRDVQNMIGRKNLGVRLFNVSSMLSNLLSTPDGKRVLVQLVNYSDYPVENVTVHVLGKFTKARVLMPEGVEKAVDVYENEEGTGVDLDLVKTCAAVILE